MKYLPLIWSGIWRKRGRTIFILLQVSVAFALFGVLQGMKTGVELAIARTRADLLMVFPDAFGEPPLPRAYLDKIQPIPGVKSVTFADGIPGNYQKPDQVVFVLGIDPTDLWLTLLPEIFAILPADLQALRSNRSGVLVTTDIAKKYGWKIGDRIPLTSPTLRRDGTGNWAFDIVGTFVSHEPGGGSFIVGNYTFVDEARVANKGTVRNFYVVTSDPAQAATVAETIDRTFANAPSETSTAIRSFPIIASMMTEAILLSLPGALLGVGLAWLLFNGLTASPFGLSFQLAVTAPIAAVGVCWALVMGLVGGVFPALRAARVPVTAALRAT